MANPLAMTDEEQRLADLYGQPEASPYSTYVDHEDPFQKFIASVKKKELDSLAGQGTLPPEAAAPVPVPTGGAVPNQNVPSYQGAPQAAEFAAPEETPEETPEHKALRQAGEKAYGESIANQTKNIGELESQYGKYGKNVRTDLSPLLGAMGIIADQDFVSKYQKPLSPDEIAAKKLALGHIIQAAKEGVTKDQLARLKDLSAEKSNKQLFDLMKMRGTQGRFEEKNLLTKEDNIRKDLDTSINKPYTEKQMQFGMIDQAFATGDYQTIGATLAQFARGVSGEKGVLTDNDIHRVMPPNIYGDAAKIRAYFSKTPSSQMPPEYVDKLKQLTELARANTEKVYSEILKSKRGVYSKSKSYSPLFIPGESGDMMFGEVESKFQKPPTPGGTAPVAPPTYAPTKTGGTMSFEEWKKRQTPN